MYTDKFGFIHNIPVKEIDYMKELDRLYKKAVPIPIKDNNNVNEVKKLHKTN